MLNESDERILYEKFISKFEILDTDVQNILKNSVVKSFKKDDLIYPKDSCYGFIIVKTGSLRAYISTSNFKEITVFSLNKGDTCILCGFCSFGSINAELNLQITCDSQVILIPKPIYKNLKDNYTQIANFTLNLVSSRFSSIVNVMEQALFLPLTKRIVNFLTDQGGIGVKITHEQLANHLGSAREAISRILKEMQKAGIVEQKRGTITLLQNLHCKESD